MKVSIITASYNYAQYIEEAIKSVISQSYQDWELLIVDDGSSDNSVEIIKQYCEKDGRIKLFQHENGQNKGLKETILLGLSHATGDWVAFLESDDVLLADNLQKKVEIIKKYPYVKLIFNKMSYLCETPESKKPKKFHDKHQRRLAKMHFPRNMFYNFYVRNMILSFSCVMVEAKALNAADFDTTNDILLDWWLWISLSQKNDFYYVDEELTAWRLHEKSYISQNDAKKRHLIPRKAYFKIFKKTLNPKILVNALFSEVLIMFYAFCRNVRYRFNFFSKNNNKN